MTSILLVAELVSVRTAGLWGSLCHYSEKCLLDELDGLRDMIKQLAVCCWSFITLFSFCVQRLMTLTYLFDFMNADGSRATAVLVRYSGWYCLSLLVNVYANFLSGKVCICAESSFLVLHNSA